MDRYNVKRAKNEEEEDFVTINPAKLFLYGRHSTSMLNVNTI